LPSNGASKDPWAVPTFLVWLVLFVAGLFPERTFLFLRELGGVTIYNAMVNSPQALTIALTLYMALFLLRDARAAGLTFVQRAVRATFIAIVAYVAFMPIDSGPATAPIVVAITTVVWSAKVVMWLYLLGLLVRYYLLGNRQAFIQILPLPDRVGPPEPASAPAQDPYREAGDESRP